jgi:iron-sulfur cluster assembly protein
MNAIEIDAVNETAGAIEPVVEFTGNAQKQIQRVLERKAAPGAFIRIGIRGGGCSGLSYIFKPDTEMDEMDRFWTLPGGLRIVTDERSIRYLSGTTVDYDTRNLMEGGFKFDNPHAAKSCGCGTSFTPK